MHVRRRRVRVSALIVLTASLATTRAESAGSALDGAPRFIEPLDEPSAVAVAADGSIHVCEALRHRVSVFDRRGIPLRHWGRFGRGEGEFDEPRGIAVGDDGRVYVADSGNDRIEVFTSEGRFERQWGRHGTESGEFDRPMGLAVGHERVYVADTRNNRIQVFRRDGTFLFFVWSYGYRDGAFDEPVDVAVDADGGFYVADRGNSRVQKFSPDGSFALAWGGRGRRGGLLVEPGGLDERDGRVVVADPDTHRVVAFDRSGTLLGEWSVSGEDGASGIDAPSSVAFVPASDDFVVCSAIEDRCQIVSFGKELGPAPDAGSRRIARDGYAVAGAGNAFVVSSRETGTPFLVDVSRRSPSVVVAFGGPGREPLEFMRPAGFVVDFASETVLVSDSGNARLQRLRLGRTPGNPRRFDPARTAFIEDLDLDDQERLDIEPARWDLDPATVAPGTLVRDRRRRLVVADTASRRIVLLGKDFRLVGAWGGFGDEDGRFRQTAGLALDPAGETLYVLDSGRRRVQAFDLDGRFLFAWGGPGDEPGAFTAPSGIAAGRDGSIYVVDRGANRVQRFDRRGVRLSAWGSAGTGPGQFWKPEGVHVDGRGRVIVLDSGNRRAQAFTSSGRFLWEMPLDPAKLPVGSAHGSKPAPPAAPIAETPGACRLNAASNAGRYTVCATSIPDPVPLNQPFALSVAIYDNVRRGELAQRVILNVDAAMPEHRHGMSLTPKVRAASGPVVQDVPHGHGAMGDGRFEIEGMLFHMPGRWEFHFDITHGAITERAQIAIDLD